MSRKMVTIRVIEEILPIEGADKIEVLKFDGWQCVSGKGNFTVGDAALYFEIDSFLPTSDERFKFLEKNAISWNGKIGARIKTIRLRGQLSQGLCLPLSEFPEIDSAVMSDSPDNDIDFAAVLGVEKWEPVIPSQLAGQVKGNFPSFLRKTDQERIQNIWNSLTKPRSKIVTYDTSGEDNHVWDFVDHPRKNDTYEVTVKLDGSSMTVYLDTEGNFGVCSRNLDLIETEDNAFWRVTRRERLEEKLRKIYTTHGPIALQGELIGPGVQGNHENLKELEFRVFDIFSIADQRYMSPTERQHLADANGILHVPMLFGNFSINKFETIDDALAFASGPSLNNDTREGIVFKSNQDSNFSFKIISNEYLLKHGDR